MLNPIVENALIEIYKAVADAADGGDELPADVLSAYHEAYALPEVQAFYDDLVDARHDEVYGGD